MYCSKIVCGGGWLVLAVAWLVAGCQLAPPLPAADWTQPGWTVRRGQAVWHQPKGSAPELAGELILSTTPDGRTFVQFSKEPFPIIVAQRTPKSWEFRVPAKNRRWSGYGDPPGRIPWLHLPEALAGRPAPPWRLGLTQPNRGRFENPKTGEFIEFVLDP
jgi:hypothetical protein